MREVLRSYPAALAVLALVAAAVLPSGCGSSTLGPRWRAPAADLPQLAGRGELVQRAETAQGTASPPSARRGSTTLSPPRGEAFAVAGLFPGSYEHSSYGTHDSPYRTVPLHMSVQITPETGARLGGAGVKLGKGEGWSVTFADNHVGGEAWIGGGLYDIEGSSSDAALFFIRGGLRMAYLEAPPFYGFVAAGFSLDWVSSSEFGTLGTVDIGDEDDWLPVGFYFRFGGGLALGNVLCYAEFATTGALVSDADFITQGWFTTWGGSLGVGFVF